MSRSMKSSRAIGRSFCSDGMGNSESSEIGAGTADPALGVGRSASVRAIGRSISPPIGSISLARAPPMGAGKSISVPEAADMGAGRSVPPGPSSGAGRSMSANGSKPEGSAWAFGIGRSATPESSNGSKSRDRPPFFGAGRSAKSPPPNGAGRSTSPAGAGKSEGGDLIAAAGAAGGTCGPSPTCVGLRLGRLFAAGAAPPPLFAVEPSR